MPIFDKVQSRIRLWVGNGKELGNVYYSILNQDKKTDDFIIEKMTKRILERKYERNFSKAIFYNNVTGAIIKEFEGNLYKNISIDKEKALVKLWIGFADNRDNQTWYNYPSESELSITEIVNKMQMRIIAQKLRYNFTKAMFFNIGTGQMIRLVEGNTVQK